jgi:hypothetical protein
MRFVWTLLLLPLVMGCATCPWKSHGISSETSSADCDAQTIGNCAARMERCVGLIQRLGQANRRHRGFLLPRDHDFLECNLAEYLDCRNELEKVANRQQPQNADLHRLSLRCKAEYDVIVASFAMEDPILWRALNQSFYRSGIPPGSCDRILHEVTASPVVGLTGDAQVRVNDVIRHRGWVLPAVENELWHAPPMELLTAFNRSISGQLRRNQNILATGFGRLRNPTVRPLMISGEQRQQIRDALQPGDILLTYSAGYVCNLFVPGYFKHVAIFVGTDGERHGAGFPSERLLAIADTSNQRLAEVLTRSVTANGEAADVVEAVAEGVLLNNLNRILASRTNCLVALRPRLSESERAEQLRDVLSYVGDDYDFSFDLTDASNQVCTELVYRSLQGRGGVDLPLSMHAGRLTLPPDDILKYYVQQGGNLFACVLVVDEAPETDGMARILRANEAQNWITRLLDPDW